MIERFVVGLVGAPFGLKGFVKVRPLSGEIDHLLTLQSVLVRQNGTERVWKIEETAPALPAMVIKFAGIDSPEAAKALTGAELVTDREHASPLQSDEYYVEDLRGMEVLSEPDLAHKTGEILGHITDILEGGGGSLAEIRLPNGELKLVPFRNEFFADIDPEKGRTILLKRWILE
jgi:16S rRNA processing protein RimM